MTLSVTSLNAEPRGRFSRNDRGLLAQRQSDRGRNFQKQAEERFNKMCEFLVLDEQQKKEARKLFDARRNEMRKIMGDARKGKLSREETRARMAESFKNYREKFENLLTEEQKAKLELWEQENQRRDRRGGSAPGANLFEKLDLDDSQKEQLAQNRTQHQNTLRELREKVRSGELTREGLRPLIEKENRRSQKRVEKILTAAQLEQLKELRRKARFARARSGMPGGGLLRHPGLRKARFDHAMRGMPGTFMHHPGLRETRFAHAMRGMPGTFMHHPGLRKTRFAHTASRMVPGKRPGATPLAHFLGAVRKQMDLSDEQREQIRKIVEPYKQQAAELLRTAREQDLSREKAREKMKALFGNFVTEVESVLTPGQKEKLEELRHRW